jgi:two-component system, chemotaxis family, response regulator Rcp1
MSNSIEPKRILLVEDNEPDIFLTKEAIKVIDRPIDVYVVTDGDAAVKALYQEGPFSNEPLPDLVLLDINLPKKNGLEVLAEVRKNPNLCRVPIFILSSSGRDEDIELAYKLHVNAFLTKPVEFKEFQAFMKLLGSFWFSFVIQPKANLNS